MQEIARLQEAKPLSDSTLEMTVRESSDNTASLQKIVHEKEAEIERLRNYYTNVIDKIEQEHRDNAHKTEGNTQKLTSDLKRSRE